MKRTATTLPLIAGLLFANTADAAILWEFTYTGDTAGEVLQIQTDGDLVNGVALPGTYNIIEAVVIASSVQPSSVGNVLTDFQASSGFIWDGSMLTQAFRANGNFTNGVNLNDNGVTWSFGPDRGTVDAGGEGLGEGEGNATTGGLTVSVVPEPSSLALLALGGLMMARRRRA